MRRQPSVETHGKRRLEYAADLLCMQAAQKPAEAETRTQFLTREQVVKILEFLHQDDE